MAGEEPVCQPRQTLLAPRGRAGRHHLVDQGVGVPGAAQRAGADQALQLGQQEEVAELLALLRQAPCLVERRADLLAGEEGAAAEQVGQRVEGPADMAGVVEADLGVATGHALDDALGRRGQDPAQVLRQDEVPRGTQDVGAQEGAAVVLGPHRGIRRAPGAQAEGEERVVALLGLHAGQQPHRVGRAGQWRRAQALGRQALAEEAAAVHAHIFPEATDRRR